MSVRSLLALWLGYMIGGVLALLVVDDSAADEVLTWLAFIALAFLVLRVTWGRS